MQRTNYNNIKKLGLCVIAFEGTELLYNILSELRDSVDYISIGLQKVSYHGDRIDQIDLNEIYRLRDEDKLVDSIVDINLDMKDEPRVQETHKRNMLIQDAEDNGCTHCIVIDSDEYYTKKSFDTACKIIDEHDYEITYCQYINYYHDYMHFLVYPFKQGMYVPFVTKVKYRHSFECTDFNLPSDPTRRFVRPYKSLKKFDMGNGQTKEIKEYLVDNFVFPWKIVKMHHLSWLRADIRKKLNMWSSKTCFKNFNDLIDRAVDNFNHFDPNCKKAEALMLFNTPGNKVDVGSFDKQYIFPKTDYHTRLRKVQNYKKLLVLSMSANIPIYNDFEVVCNETWRKIDHDKYKNIDVTFWTYTDAAEGKNTYVDKENHIIYIKRDYNSTMPNFYKTFSKTIYALQKIKEMNIEYDYVIRTNNSTWINIPLINHFLSYQEDDSLMFCSRIFAAYWSAYNMYGSGEMFIMSQRNVNILLDMSKDPEKIETKMPSADDNLIFALFNNRLNTLKLPQMQYLHSLEGEKYYNITEVPDDIKFDRVSYQVKTFTISDNDERHDCDIQKMRDIQAQWDKLENYDCEKMYNNLMEKYYDKIIHVLPYTKDEWNNKITDNQKMLAQFKYNISREEYPKYANEKQMENKYTVIKFK